MKLIVPIGPQHPALKEPEHFRFEVRGEEIVGVGIRLGYCHRGIERAMQERPYVHNVYLSERVCGICNVSHTTAYCQTVEGLANMEVPDRARYIRTILAELERIHSHLLWAGIAAHEIGFDTLFMLFWRDREHVLDVKEMISGNRQASASNTIGGVRRDIRPEQIPKITQALKKLEQATKYYVNVCTSDRTIFARCKDVGVLTKEDARKLCAVGPTARASGVDADVRRDDPYAAYGEVSFKVVVEPEGDVLARVVVRLLEILESIGIIRQAIDALPSGPLKAKVAPRIEPNEATGRVEAPRGELLYYAISNGIDKPERVRIRTPTYANIPTFNPLFVGGTTAEIPIVVASIDPCFACTDRVAIVNSKSGESRAVTLEELRRSWK